MSQMAIVYQAEGYSGTGGTVVSKIVMQCNKCSDGGSAGRELWEPRGWAPNLGSGVREGFLEEVITKLRLKGHKSLPVCLCTSNTA